MGHVLRFITGKYAGGEFPLKPNREFFVGRGSEFDMVLDDDMVSRRHAKISTFSERIHLTDLKSTNGTMVNGDTIESRELEVGDRVAIGTSVMELRSSGEDSVTEITANQLKRSSTSESTGRSTVHRAGLQGAFPGPGTTLPELVRMVSRSKKAAVLELRSSLGERIKLYFREGDLIAAKVREPEDLHELVGAQKAFYRAMCWSEGTYKVRGYEPDRQFDDPLVGELAEFLERAQEQVDQFADYAEHLPASTANLKVSAPLVTRLAELSAEALDTFQLVMNHGTVQDVVNHSSATDLETYQDLIYLIESDYLKEA